MNVGLRELLSDLEAQDQLYRIDQPVSLRHVPALIDQSDRAVCFNHVSGYSMPLVSGLTNDRQRLSIATGVPFAHIESLVRRGMDTPIPPVVVDDAVCQEVVQTGEDVDHTALPVDERQTLHTPVPAFRDWSATSPACCLRRASGSDV